MDAVVKGVVGAVVLAKVLGGGTKQAASTGSAVLDPYAGLRAAIGTVARVGRPIPPVVAGKLSSKQQRWKEDTDELRRRLYAAGWSVAAVAMVEAGGFTDAQQMGIYYGPPRAIVDGRKLETWEQFEVFWRAIEDWRIKVDDKNTSSSFDSLAKLGGHFKAPSWMVGSRTGFYWWAFHHDGPEGWKKHLLAVQKRIEETGGNESFWGPDGGFGSIVKATKLIGNIAGLVFGAPGLGTAVGGGLEKARDTAEAVAKGEWNKLEQSAEDFLANSGGI